MQIDSSIALGKPKSLPIFNIFARKMFLHGDQNEVGGVPSAQRDELPQLSLPLSLTAKVFRPYADVLPWHESPVSTAS